MKTKIYEIGSAFDAALIEEAGSIIRQGGLVAFPTETVYGLGGDALNPLAAERIYAAKGRPADNPLIIHLCRTEDVKKIADDIPALFYVLAEKFWPGPLTMIVKKSSRVPDSTTGGLPTVAVRMPDHAAALCLINAAGGFVAAPSANLSGRPSPTVSKYVVEDMNGRIDMILAAGQTEIGVESTILDLSGAKPEILRPGAVTQAMLAPFIGIPAKAAAENEPDGPPRAPGMKYRHYAPKGFMQIVKGEEKAVISYINENVLKERANNLITGVIASTQTSSEYLADIVKSIGSRLNDEEIARSLYRILREFDDERADVIYSEAFSGYGMGQAIMNRLLKASSGQVIHLRAKNGG